MIEQGRKLRAMITAAVTTSLDSMPRDLVANVTLVGALDKLQLPERAGKLSRRELVSIFAGIDIVLGR